MPHPPSHIGGDYWYSFPCPPWIACLLKLRLVKPTWVVVSEVLTLSSLNHIWRNVLPTRSLTHSLFTHSCSICRYIQGYKYPTAFSIIWYRFRYGEQLLNDYYTIVPLSGETLPFGLIERRTLDFVLGENSGGVSSQHLVASSVQLILPSLLSSRGGRITLVWFGLEFNRKLTLEFRATALSEYGNSRTVRNVRPFPISIVVLHVGFVRGI